ncbi:MAG: hypothetical protein MSA15_10725 [Clostridium sp.]|nr:hypothetical protein [Clostridium sp.]
MKQMNEMSEETRREANEKVDKTKREIQVLQILSEYKELTAKQIARYMAYRNYTKEIDYNHARPRLTSLLEKRQVCIVGKELDTETHCKEVIYQITELGKERLNNV